MARKNKPFTTTIHIDVLNAARNKSNETDIPLSAVVERFLAFWVNGGELPSKQPVSPQTEARQNTSRAK